MNLIEWLAGKSGDTALYSVMNDDHVHLYETLNKLADRIAQTCLEDRRVQSVKADQAGRSFIAISDPGTFPVLAGGITPPLKGCRFCGSNSKPLKSVNVPVRSSAVGTYA